MQPLTLQEVETHVRRYWTAFENKDIAYIPEAYSQAAMIFTTSSKRVELGRLVSMHRQREYLAPQTKLRILVKDVYVHLTSAKGAVAAYILEFHAEHLPARSATAKPLDEHHSNARITHVLERADDGELRIIHEHISIAQS